MRATFLLLVPAIATCQIAGCGLRDSFGSARAIQQAAPVAKVAVKPDKSDVDLFVSYLMAERAFISAVPAPDQRPKQQILADLKAIPQERLLALRPYVLKFPHFTRKALDLLGQLLPTGHQEFLFQAIEDPRWCAEAAEVLAEQNDARLVGPILDRSMTRSMTDLLPLVRPDNPAFLAALRRKHADLPTEKSTFLIGAYGRLAEKEIRQAAAFKNKALRNQALFGLSVSADGKSLPLLLELANLGAEDEWQLVARRFIAEGPKHVPDLLKWLEQPPDRERVAAYALARIKSDVGVARVLSRYQDEPFDNSLASESARSGPAASVEFVSSRIAGGTRQQKLNALLIVHHYLSWQPAQPGQEHPMMQPVLQATRDSDADVRREAAQRLAECSFDASYPEGRVALRRLVEMLRDPSPGVRQEAALQASQYPCPDVTPLLKAIAESDSDPKVRESVGRSAARLEEMLRRLPGTGRKPVRLDDHP